MALGSILSYMPARALIDNADWLDVKIKWYFCLPKSLRNWIVDDFFFFFFFSNAGETDSGEQVSVVN